MSDKPITNVATFFLGIPKGKRKPVPCSIRLGTLDGHRLLSDEELTSWVNHASGIIAAEGYKNAANIRVAVNFGKDDGEMRFIELISKQVRWL